MFARPVLGVYVVEVCGGDVFGEVAYEVIDGIAGFDDDWREENPEYTYVEQGDFAYKEISHDLSFRGDGAENGGKAIECTKQALLNFI